MGFPSYTYQWYYMYPSSGGGAHPAISTGSIKPNVLPLDTWYPLGTNSTTLYTSFVQNAELKCVVTDSKGLTGTSNIIFISVRYSSSNETANKAADAKLNNFESEQSNKIAEVSSYKLDQNYPNPFNPSNSIHYEIPANGLVTLIIYDDLGKEVSTLVNQYQDKGRYNINFNASNLSSGIYFYKLKAGDYISIKKMIVLK